MFLFFVCSHYALGFCVGSLAFYIVLNPFLVLILIITVFFQGYHQKINTTSSMKIVINLPDIKLYNSIFSKGFASKFCLKSGPWARKSA